MLFKRIIYLYKCATTESLTEVDVKSALPLSSPLEVSSSCSSGTAPNIMPSASEFFTNNSKICPIDEEMNQMVKDYCTAEGVEESSSNAQNSKEESSFNKESKSGSNNSGGNNGGHKDFTGEFWSDQTITGLYGIGLSTVIGGSLVSGTPSAKVILPEEDHVFVTINVDKKETRGYFGWYSTVSSNETITIKGPASCVLPILKEYEDLKKK